MRLANSSMQGPTTVSSSINLEQFDWAEISQRLTKYAKHRLGTRGTWQDAEQLAQEAICRFLDPEYAAWDTEKQPDIMLHLGSIVNGVLANHVRKWENCKIDHKEPNKLGAEIDNRQRRSGNSISAEGKCSDSPDARKVLSILTDRLAQDSLCQEVLLLHMDGIDRPAEQATALERPVKEINNARRRLDDHLQAVRRMLEQEN